MLDLAKARGQRAVARERARGERRRPRPTAGLAPEIEALVLGLAADCAAIRSDLYRLIALLAPAVER